MSATEIYRQLQNWLKQGRFRTNLEDFLRPGPHPESGFFQPGQIARSRRLDQPEASGIERQALGIQNFQLKPGAFTKLRMAAEFAQADRRYPTRDGEQDQREIMAKTQTIQRHKPL